MIPLGRFLEEEFVASKFIAHCAPSQRRALKQVLQPNVASCIMIGPEGDFTDLEINSATSKGFLPVDLGTSRLRTETAAVGACYSFYFVNQ